MSGGGVRVEPTTGVLGLVSPTTVTKAPSGAPLWPRGIVGSLAHDRAVAVAAVARAADISCLGIDIEPAERIDDLGEAARQTRVAAIFRPYHNAVAAALDRRATEGRASVLVALHSFTPVFKGIARPWHVAVLFNRDPRLAHPLAKLLRADTYS